MSERLSEGTGESGPLAMSLYRASLSYLEGVRIYNGRKSVRIRVLLDNYISVVEIVGGKEKKPDVFPLPVDETYEGEIEDGKTFCVSGGEMQGRRRTLGFAIPPDFNIKRVVRGMRVKR